MADKKNVYQKLQEARTRFSNTELKKTGKNDYAGFMYFQLQDFVPTINRIFSDVGLIGIFNYDPDGSEPLATMTVCDVDNPDDEIVFKRPAVEAKTSNNPIQNAGATDTYLRRYMWLMAMDIVENDMTDAVAGRPEKPESEKKAKPEPKPAGAPPITKEQIEIIKNSYPESAWQGIAGYFKKNSIEELTTVEAMTIIKKIEKRKKNAGN